MMFPISHKTVFVLDHSPYFAKSSNQTIEYDMQRTKASGCIPAAPISKSLWTCCVEGLQEYLRIVMDIYPKDKQVQIVVGNSVLVDWNSPDVINISMTKFAQIGPPKLHPKEDIPISHSLSLAIDCLRQPTQQQKQAMEEMDFVKNRGRIICLTALKDDAYAKSLEDYVQTKLNTLSVSTEMLPLDACHLALLHTVPLGQDLHITERPLKEISPNFSSEVLACTSGRNLYNKLVLMCCHHFGLTSTTVTGIPMKEEQNASSSANYDVELLHPAAAHDDMFKSEHAEGLVIPSKEGLPIETAPLKWCTPKSSAIELQNCSAAYRICPVDVNSRPSSCLTNFLLSGRAVLLEQPRRSGNKVISHMLASHGGEIFIHSIPTSRSLLEDPPSIIEGCGGRVTDYRITAFGDFMKENRLAPAPEVLRQRLGDKKPDIAAIEHLERGSRVWPLIISDTILFNLGNNIHPLPQLITQESLSEDETLECKKVVLRVLAMEHKNDSLPVPATGSRGKGPKREEQYRRLWAELEALVAAYADTSVNHAKVLECVQECKKPVEDSGATTGRKVSAKKEDKATGSESTTSGSTATSEAEQGWRELDRFQAMTEREKRDALQEEKPFQSSPPKKIKTEELLMRSGGQTLTSMWNNRLQAIQNKRSHEFDGRLQSNSENKTRLYIHLDEDNSGDQT